MEDLIRADDEGLKQNRGENMCGRFLEYPHGDGRQCLDEMG